MSLLQVDPLTLGRSFIKSLDRAGIKPSPNVVNVRDALAVLARQPCEIGFVVGDCATPENEELLRDANRGDLCWTCYARKMLQAVRE